MEITSAEFVISNTDVKKCPAGIFPEYAFIGRSNVGKSSLINMLTSRKGLAMTSSTPGKTMLINHFLINKNWYLVDLPGYGYARRGQKGKDQIRTIIEDYILEREQMTNLFVLIDSRLEPQKIDLEFMEWLGENGIPFSIIFTKADKLKGGRLKMNINAYLRELGKQWEELPPHFVSSSEDRTGRVDILNYIENINKDPMLNERRMKMKKSFLSIAFLAVFVLTATNSQAQSWSDLLNKDNISKVVNAITGTTESIDMTGTWSYKGSAVEFESDNLLMKAGGAAAATMAENKLNEQLSKIGIKDGQMSFTFNADSTFTSTVGKKTLKGTYSYNASTKQVDLKYLKLLNLHAKVNCSSSSLELLFNSDKLLKLMAFIGSKSSSTALKTVSSLAENYDGMMLGFQLSK